MPSDDQLPTAAPTASPTIAAPRRDKRLVPTARQGRTRPVAAVPIPRKPAAGRPVALSAVESKVNALQDPEEILQVVRTEAALRRAQRLSGQGDAQRQTIRLLSICMLFALLAAAIGAMWYLQTSLQGSHHARHAPAATDVKPAPAPAQAGRR